MCLPFLRCLQNQRLKSQLFSLQQWPPAPAQILPSFQQQQVFCTFNDQFGRSSYGICCVDMENVGPLPPVHIPPAELPAKPDEPNFQQSFSNSDDSEVLEADLNNYQPLPPTYDNTDNTIDYDPIENLKQVAWLSNTNSNNNFIRYPWPQQQFVGFTAIQQWPPPVPTHPPSLASWPPPLPTHPPNHHYPTHPPLNGNNGAGSSSTNYYPTTTTSSTTRRPQYTGFPSHRPPSTSSTTTTVKPHLTEAPVMGLPLQCGLKSVDSPDQERIVGGTNASPHEFPWIAVLFKSGKQFCGGSLITNVSFSTA